MVFSLPGRELMIDFEVSLPRLMSCQEEVEV